MSILGVLIPISLVLVGIAVWAFFWATNSGQFDDLDTPALQAVLDDERAPPAAKPDGPAP
jgi:cbb3-type cytochrome oxidase maturation protein